MPLYFLQKYRMPYPLPLWGDRRRRRVILALLSEGEGYGYNRT